MLLLFINVVLAASGTVLTWIKLVVLDCRLQAPLSTYYSHLSTRREDGALVFYDVMDTFVYELKYSLISLFFTSLSYLMREMFFSNGSVRIFSMQIWTSFRSDRINQRTLQRNLHYHDRYDMADNKSALSACWPHRCGLMITHSNSLWRKHKFPRFWLKVVCYKQW